MIRFVCADDAEAIAGIYNYYVRETTVSFEAEPLEVGAMRERIAEVAAGFPFLVWEEAGVICGYAYAHLWKERAAYAGTWELSIYLAPECCGRGLGRRLLARLVEECRAAGCRVLIACITCENDRSCAFHRRLGFEPVSHFVKVGCKFGRLLDVVDYQLLL